MMVNFSQPQTTHITTTLSDQKQEGNPIHQQHIQQNQLFYMSHHLVDHSYIDSNNNNNNSTNKNHLESNNYSPTPCFYYLQEESLEDLERECRRCTQLEIMSSNEPLIHSNRTNLTQNVTSQSNSTMIKPIIIERHGIFPLSDSNSNTTFGKLRNNTNSNRGIMITTQTTSEPLSTSPHHPNTQHEQSVLPNLQLSNNNPLIFQNTNQQHFQMHPPSIITNALSDSNMVTATGTNSYVVDHDAMPQHQQQHQHVVVSHAFGGQVSNSSLNNYDHANSAGGVGGGNAQSLNTMIVNAPSAILQDDTFSELLLTDLDDDFLQSPTINNNNNTNYGSYVGGQVSSTSTPEDAPPTNLLFETKTKRQKKRGKLPVHVEIPPPLLAPNQPNVISPQQTMHSSNLMSGANPNNNPIRKKKTGKNKRKQSVASSSSMASSAATTNTTIGGGSSSTGNGQQDYNFYYGANQSVGGGSSAMNILPMFPHTNFHLDGSGPDEESGAAPRRKRGRPPTV